MSYVTLPYPFEPVEAPPEYRGKPEIDPKKCIGCGACSRACPPDAIRVEDDLVSGVRRIILDVSRCIRCARCEEVCPTGAIKLTREFELASPSKEDLLQTVEMRLARCSICGKYVGRTVRQIEKAKAVLSPLPRDRLEELLRVMTLCEDCRKRRVAQALQGVPTALLKVWGEVHG